MHIFKLLLKLNLKNVFLLIKKYINIYYLTSRIYRTNSEEIKWIVEGIE